tara:strand:- start:81 stop:1985 length:1905 start_codon:yes stop_codon:yes gene_type:complete
MPINTGESKMSKNEFEGTSVIPIRGNEYGMTDMIDVWRSSITFDQQYREFTQNSIESIQRVQQKNSLYKGEILWTTCKYKGVNKLTIIDNGEGMTPEQILKNLGELGGSSRNNRYKNFGCGAKIAGLSWNKYGIIYKCWVDGKGFAVHFLKHPITKLYGALKINKVAAFPINESEKPSMIDQHGCQVILLGDSLNQDTAKPPSDKLYGMLKGSKTSVGYWLAARLNTRFYTIPVNIKIQTDRFGYNREHRKNSIFGHEYGLNKEFKKTDEICLNGAAVKIFYKESVKREYSSGSDFVTQGQLAVLNQDEVVKIDFAGKSGTNPLPAWGLSMLRRQVALVVIPDKKFTQDLERKTLVCEGMPIEVFLNSLKEEFKEKMPPWLKEIENKMQQEALDKDNDHEERLKKLLSLFKKDRYRNSLTGEVDIQENEIRRASSYNQRDHSDSDPNPDLPPKDEYGKIEAIFGMKIDRSKYTGRKIKAVNEFPEIRYRKSGPSHFVGDFFKDDYAIEINEDSHLIIELTNHLLKKFKSISSKNMIREVSKHVGFALQQQVAHIHNRTDASEEEKQAVLSSWGLTACAANKDFIIERLSTKFKAQINLQDEKLKETIRNGKDKFPSLNIHSYNPNKYVYKNSRK